MKNALIVALAFLAISCGTDSHDLTVKVRVDGLKKGTVYLEQQQDSTFVVVDSVVVNGNPEFQLHSSLNEPQVLSIKLNKNDNDDRYISFFADKGITEINTTLKNFNFDASIKGSKQQEVLEEYLLMISKFNNKNLDLIKEHFESEKSNDSISFDFETQYNTLIKRKYLYTINFAVNHKDSEVSPYLALTEIPNTSVKYLETIYDALNDNIKASLYGKKLKAEIEVRKADSTTVASDTEDAQ
ncbi:DUF4369 domain-containing protein [Mangrovimonas sp. DI 80]|uniref:DUF4369 domain-containing protein n=1 Tax=Mangrovimonas sp. DI 80 TaxID=1779330 RepID=UPI00097754C7|nr:DUF4369 domain-containing protein [Mangrovimonas sp. DI 80]OMP31079.1 hypothetical protein BKM32_08410 [Mangrovimonas sp. DI 80]